MEGDPEIELMDTIASGMTPMEQPARNRILTYMVGRFGDNLTQTLAAQRAITQPGLQSSFESFADLFAGADPKTDKEKALVAAYWTQICENQPNFPSQSLNAALKDLGHGVGNITDALDALKDEKPSLILQLKKSGTSKQARKTYKLTLEGAKRVQQMISKEEA